MRYKLILLIVIISAILSGCMYGGDDERSKNNIAENEKYITIKYVDKGTIIDQEDFPDFKLIDNIYYIASENMSFPLQAEIGHGTFAINGSDEVPQGYRICGGSEIYNSSDRYLLIQYKVFDDNEDLNESIDTTVDYYIQSGYKLKSLDNSLNNSYRKVFVLESNATDNTDMNIIVVLFGFDTVIGKIGVQDYKDKSFNESLKILDTLFDRLKVNTKEIKVVKRIARINFNKENV